MNPRHLIPALALAATAACSSTPPADNGAATGNSTTPTTPTSTMPSGPSTSILPSGARCLVVTIEAGKTVLTDDQVAVGSICDPAGGNAAGFTSTTCADGTKLYSAAGKWWWKTGQAVQAGSVPNDAIAACR